MDDPENFNGFPHGMKQFAPLNRLIQWGLDKLY